MAIPTSRQGLIDYALRSLGAPVLEINVSPEQIEDRVDEAIQFWQEYNSEATYRTYLRFDVTEEMLNTNEIKLDPSILSAVRILPLQVGGDGSNLFSTKTQVLMQFFEETSGTTGAPGGSGIDLVGYEILKESLEMFDDVLRGHGYSLMFSRYMNVLKFNVPIKNDVGVGDAIVVECYKIIDVDTYPAVYNDASLKEMLTLLIKKQWGANMMKFDGMQLPGGITVNGRQLYDDAVADLNEFKTSYALRYEEPATFYIG